MECGCCGWLWLLLRYEEGVQICFHPIRVAQGYTATGAQNVGVELMWDLLTAVNTINVAKRGVISSLGCFCGEMRLLICRSLYDW